MTAVIAAMTADLADVAPGDTEHVAEQDVIEMHVGLDLDIKDQAKPEHAGENDAHHRILFDTAVIFQETGGESAKHAGREGADREGYADDIGDDHAGKDGVADGVSHQRPAFQNQEAGQQRHRDCDQHRDHQRIDHEAELERRKKRLDHVHGAASSACAARLRAASMPCLGAKKNAIRKIAVCSTTMMPPVAPSRK